MPARGGVLRVRGKLTNVEQVRAGLQRLHHDLDPTMEDGVRELGNLAVDIFKAAAPKGRTHQLERGIKARKRGTRGIDITVHAVNPETGYDYADVTRKGHRVEEIVPTEGRKALRLRFNSGDVKFFDRVRGVEVHRDWVDDAIPAVLEASDAVMKQMSRDLDLRVFS